MNRETKFRGKCIDTREWVYGYYIKHLPYTPGLGCGDLTDEYEHFIMHDGFSDWNMPRNTVHFKVDPKTVGQYTGYNDINGCKIYDDDIVKCKYWVNDCNKEEYYITEKVEYENGCYYPRVFENNCDDPWYSNGISEMEKLGNVHDNPEFLNGD